MVEALIMLACKDGQLTSVKFDVFLLDFFLLFLYNKNIIEKRLDII